MKSTFFKKTLLLICATVFILFPQKEALFMLEFNEFPEKNLFNITPVISEGGKKAYTIADLSYDKNINHRITECLLSFNVESRDLWKDDTGKYTVLDADYIFTSNKQALGKGCAYFYKKNHQVRLESSKNLWLGSCNDLGSFTIEMRFMTKSLKEGGVLFSRIGYLSGNKKGIIIDLNKGRVQAHFYNVFEKNRIKRFTVHLNRGGIVRKGNWHHILISFDRNSGRLSKYLDGHEEETVYVTDDGSPYNNVYAPSFGYRNDRGELSCLDSPQAIIGKDFIGYIDELRISYEDYSVLQQKSDIASTKYKGIEISERTPINIEGVITSPVYTFENTGTMIKEINWDQELKKNTFIWLEFRISDYLFNETNSDLKWYRITRGQRNIFLKKDRSEEYLRGKYFQWRAHLVASPEGTESPELSTIKVSYMIDKSPNPPEFLETKSIGDKVITLRWMKNVDSDISGYRVYYGIKNNTYDGIISQINGEPITNSTSKGDYIEITITNDVIEENRALDRRRLLSYPVFKNTVLYYFAVTAYDSYKPGTPYNHESALSKSTTARPFAGSEID